MKVKSFTFSSSRWGRVFSTVTGLLSPGQDVFLDTVSLCLSKLQAGETLRNSSHSSTAADLFQARQQLLQNQQQLEERVLEVRKHQDRSREQLELISQLEHKLSQAEMVRS